MNQILIYQSEDGSTKLDVRLENQTVWLNQKQLTELFGKAKGTISEHIKHIFEDKELEEDSVVRLFRTTAADGKQYEVAHYNLDMVLALGFRVRSPVAVRFRQWAADKLKEFFATVQNKVHYAIHGQTATEVILSRADCGMLNMGFTNWEGARIRKSAVAKPCRAVPHLCRVPGRASDSHDDERLDHKTGGFLDLERPGGIAERRQNLGRIGQNPCGTRVRRVSQDRGSEPRIRLRPRRQAVAAANEGQAMTGAQPVGREWYMRETADQHWSTSQMERRLIDARHAVDEGKP